MKHHSLDWDNSLREHKHYSEFSLKHKIGYIGIRQEWKSYSVQFSLEVSFCCWNFIVLAVESYVLRHNHTERQAEPHRASSGSVKWNHTERQAEPHRASSGTTSSVKRQQPHRASSGTTPSVKRNHTERQAAASRWASELGNGSGVDLELQVKCHHRLALVMLLLPLTLTLPLDVLLNARCGYAFKVEISVIFHSFINISTPNTWHKFPECYIYISIIAHYCWLV